MEYMGNKYLVFYRGYNVWSTWIQIDNKYLVFYRGYNVWSTWVGTTNIASFIEATMYGVHG